MAFIRPRLRVPIRAATVVLVAAALAGCSLVGADDQSEGGKDVVLVTHDSFVLPKALIAQFDRQSGYHLVVHAAGDGGTLTNKLVLTQGNPTGDVAFGVDNTFASRALDAGVFAPYDVRLPAGAEQYVVPGDDGRLAPIDNGNVCVNVDTGLVRRPRPRRPAVARRPGRSRRTAACSPCPARPRAPPGWRSCSARSASTATAGRPTGRS